MPKAWTNERYNLTWTGNLTGYKYKLVITPADDTDITATDIELPDDCLLDYSFKWDYEKFPFGMYNSPTFEFTFDLDKCPANFAKALYSPFSSEMTYNNLFTWQTGNLFEFYIAYDGVTFKRQYIGVQSSGAEWQFNENDKSLNIETVDAGYFCSSTMPINILDYVLSSYSANAKKDIGYNDWYYSYLGKNYSAKTLYNQNKGLYYFWYIPIFTLFNYLDVVSLYMTRKLYRNAALTNPICSFVRISYSVAAVTNTGYCKQTYTGDGSRGNFLGYNDIYYLGYISKDTTASGWQDWIDGDGYGVGGLIEALKKEYETVWDFVKDFMQEHLVKGYFTIDNSVSPPVPRIGHYEFTTMFVPDYLDITLKEITDLRLESFEVIKKVESISIDKVAETTDKITATVKTNKNENSLSINHTVLNIPLATECTNGVYVYKNLSGFTSVDYEKTAYTDLINNTELFYYDDTNEVDIYNTFYRLHEKIKFAISDTKTTDDIITTADFDLTNSTYHPKGLINPPDYSPVKDGKGTGNISRQTIQNYTGKMNIVAETLLVLYGDNFQAKLSGNILFSDLKTDTHENLIFNPKYELLFDLSTIEPHANMFTNISNRFVVSSITFNKDEFVEFEAITRNKATL